MAYMVMMMEKHQPIYHYSMTREELLCYLETMKYTFMDCVNCPTKILRKADKDGGVALRIKCSIDEDFNSLELEILSGKQNVC